jgi:hypothetical protein
LISPRRLASEALGDGCEYSHMGFVHAEAYRQREDCEGLLGKSVECVETAGSLGEGIGALTGSIGSRRELSGGP